MSTSLPYLYSSWGLLSAKATQLAARVGQSLSSVARIMLTPASMMVLANEVAAIADIGTIIVARDCGCGGRASCIVVADARVCWVAASLVDLPAGPSPFCFNFWIWAWAFLTLALALSSCFWSRSISFLASTNSAALPSYPMTFNFSTMARYLPLIFLPVILLVSWTS